MVVLDGCGGGNLPLPSLTPLEALKHPGVGGGGGEGAATPLCVRARAEALALAMGWAYRAANLFTEGIIWDLRGLQLQKQSNAGNATNTDDFELFLT